eukprot:gene16486-biopygen15825
MNRYSGNTARTWLVGHTFQQQPGTARSARRDGVHRTGVRQPGVRVAEFAQGGIPGNAKEAEDLHRPLPTAGGLGEGVGAGGGTYRTFLYWEGIQKRNTRNATFLGVPGAPPPPCWHFSEILPPAWRRRPATPHMSGVGAPAIRPRNCRAGP